jgi:hypothetical protein
MNDQPMLFDVKRLGPVVCSVCGATRDPDEARAVACTADRDQTRRPVGCLNTYQPEHTDIPY